MMDKFNGRFSKLTYNIYELRELELELNRNRICHIFHRPHQLVIAG